jgi:glutamyl-tRNA synthetase
MIKPVRVRFAPSPTGRTHLGSGRTALFDYLLARQTGGQFILRIEDTDQKRYVAGAEIELIDSLHWLGLQWDEGPDVGGPYAPYRQSERKQIYREYAQKLIDMDSAYFCFCSSERLEKVRQDQMKLKQNPRYDGTCRYLDPGLAAKKAASGERHVIRFKMPQEGRVTAHDLLRGDITVENTSLDDSILIKSDGLAVYHLAAMLDDHLMDITHVIRGSEWLSTFPMHVHIVRAFGWKEPVWVHLSVFLKPSGKGKMSKRESMDSIKDGHSIFITDLAQLGYIPEGVVNWIALMGWSYDDRTEYFTLAELVEKFSLDHLNPAPAAINFTKLDYFNGLHIRNLTLSDFTTRIKPFFERSGYDVGDEKLLKVATLLQERTATLDEAPEKGSFFFRDEITPKPEELVGDKMTPALSAEAARRVYQILKDLPAIHQENTEIPLRDLAEELGVKAGQLFGILRVAITGQMVSPPLFQSMEVVGKEKVLERLRKAVTILENI